MEPLSDDEMKRVGQALKAHIESSGLSREQFAIRYGESKSLIDKMCAGSFSMGALGRLELKLKVRFSERRFQRVHALDRFGGYALDEVEGYLGYYYLVRPSFQREGVLHAYAMRILWSDDRGGLVVAHRPSPGARFAEIGHVSMPRNAPSIFIQSDSSDGWYQLAILSPMNYEKLMFGCLCTAANTVGASYLPIVSPVVMARQDSAEIATHKLEAGTRPYRTYRQMLDRVVDGAYVKIVV